MNELVPTYSSEFRERKPKSDKGKDKVEDDIVIKKKRKIPPQFGMILIKLKLLNVQRKLYVNILQRKAT